MKNIFKMKFGNQGSDIKIAQYIVWSGSVAFLIIIYSKLKYMNITEYQLTIGTILACIFMLLGAGLGCALPLFEAKTK